jgi:hypothetical protein
MEFYSKLLITIKKKKKKRSYAHQIEYLIFFKVITITHMASMLHPSDKINVKDFI